MDGSSVGAQTQFYHSFEGFNFNWALYSQNYASIETTFHMIMLAAHSFRLGSTVPLQVHFRQECSLNDILYCKSAYYIRSHKANLVCETTVVQKLRGNAPAPSCGVTPISDSDPSLSSILGMNMDSEDNPIEDFFARYRTFKYRPSSNWRQLGPFNALAKHCKWSDERRKEEFKRFKRTWTEVRI
jgi:hypothetical protein